jgi:1,2-diacylglycerol 3-alpha-glucosyltransferase
MSDLKIAVASSGLDHVRRGVESWANDMGIALHRQGVSVSLFQACGSAPEPWRHILNTWRRTDARTRRLLAITRNLGGWHYGCGSEYEIEQTSFALSLWKQIRNSHDILHVQDPLVARILDTLHKRGWSRPKVILAHGTEEPPEQLQKFCYLQHLAPYYLKEWERYKPPNQLVFAIPNFVDTGLFVPDDRTEARRLWRLPQDALIVLCVAAIKKHHKRCDYLIREFADFRAKLQRPAVLVIAGAREPETPEVAALGKSLLGDAFVLMESVDRGRMPSLYPAADIFAIASLHEMQGTAIVEALACGVPVACNHTPVFDWVVGPGGAPQDISQPGGLVRQFERLSDPAIRTDSSAAGRQHIEETFSETAVLRQMLEMYTTVMQHSERH